MRASASDNPAIEQPASRRAISCPEIRSRGKAALASAFTLIEMLVVVVIISILAAAMIPSMLNVGQRQAEQEARAVQRLLSIAAEKADVWNQPVAIDFAGDKSTFTIWSQRARIPRRHRTRWARGPGALGSRIRSSSR